MKIIILNLLLILSVACSQAKVKVGSTIQGLKAVNQDGKEVSLDSYKGKSIVMVYFFPRADTPGCTKQACSLRDAYAKLQKKNLTIFGVSTDGPSELKAFQKKYKVQFDFLSDSNEKWADAFGVPVRLGFASRQAFLLEDGKIVWMDRDASTSEQAADILKYLESRD